MYLPLLEVKWRSLGGSLTVAPESVWLGFHILDVGVETLPSRLSETGQDDNQILGPFPTKLDFFVCVF